MVVLEGLPVVGDGLDLTAALLAMRDALADEAA